MRALSVCNIVDTERRKIVKLKSYNHTYCRRFRVVEAGINSFFKKNPVEDTLSINWLSMPQFET
jgi:hypothetical protein